eukprot:TRINITY_DN8097_c0_g1_i1.p1 TRINITY_DN8097_c0_g1~~TRINITY_DN8097_c0_g1_i1.p1  ORF type:complete len:154 (+),score=17.62 TRINITY_DN8097_c0_g1_i1:24-464(+)
MAVHGPIQMLTVNTCGANGANVQKSAMGELKSAFQLFHECPYPTEAHVPSSKKDLATTIRVFLHATEWITLLFLKFWIVALRIQIARISWMIHRSSACNRNNIGPSQLLDEEKSFSKRWKRMKMKWVEAFGSDRKRKVPNRRGPLV